MDRDRVDAQLANLERLVDDPPPLLSLVVLANGLGIAHEHAVLRRVKAGESLDELIAALTLIKVGLDDFTERLDERLEALTSELLEGHDREIRNVIEGL